MLQTGKKVRRYRQKSPIIQSEEKTERPIAWWSEEELDPQVNNQQQVNSKSTICTEGSVRKEGDLQEGDLSIGKTSSGEDDPHDGEENAGKGNVPDYWTK